MLRLSLFEIFVAEVILWLCLWLLDDYLATLLTILLTAIVSAVLIIALIAEALERSKVPRRYFWIMGISIVAPPVAALAYAMLVGGSLEWFNP